MIEMTSSLPFRRAALAAVLASVMLPLAACGGGGDGTIPEVGEQGIAAPASNGSPEQGSLVATDGVEVEHVEQKPAGVVSAGDDAPGSPTDGHFAEGSLKLEGRGYSDDVLAGLLAVEQGPMYVASADYLIAHPELLEEGESMQKIRDMREAVNENLKTMMRGEVLNRDSFVKSWPGFELPCLFPGGCVPNTSEKSFARLSSSCRWASSSPAEYMSCIAGVYRGSMRVDGKRIPCEVEISNAGFIRFKGGDINWPVMKPRYLSAGTSYKDNGEMYHGWFDGVSGWRPYTEKDIVDDDDDDSREFTQEDSLRHLYKWQQSFGISVFNTKWKSVYVIVGNTDPSFGTVDVRVCSISD